MTPEELGQITKEMQEVIEHANEGDWLPVTFVGLCGAIVTSLVVYIFNLKDKEKNVRMDRLEEMMIKKAEEDNKRMEKLEKLLSGFGKQSQAHSEILARLENVSATQQDLLSTIINNKLAS